jgi:hypothetical protein
VKAQSAFSVKIDVNAAVSDIREQLSAGDPVLVIFFASPVYPPERIAAAFAGAFPNAVTFGCSTAGEIVTGRMLTHSVVAMAFGTDAIKSVCVSAITDLDHPGSEAFATFENHYGVPVAEMDPTRYVGVLLIDGLSRKEEFIVDRIGDLTNVNFIGGSAGDDLRFVGTHVFANGSCYGSAAVVALIEPAVPFSFVKTQSFAPMQQILTVTRANETEREVMEFDHKPAAVAYAEALGVPVEEAGAQFLSHPLGLLFEGEPFVRSPQRIKDNGMVFYCAVREGMALTLLRSTNIIDDTRRALEEAEQEFGTPSAIINFNCILRTLELRQEGLTEQYGKLFTAPTIGFSTYGEQYIGHVNQTATMLLLY